MVSGSRVADVAIMGDGLIGLSTALELGKSGAACVIVGTSRPGSASAAAAGLLAATVGHLPNNVLPFFMDSLDRYPNFVDALRPFDESLALIQGLIERGSGAEVEHPRDGAIDNVKLLAAVRRAVEQDTNIRFVSERATRVNVDRDSAEVVTRTGTRVAARRVILAAGAWCGEIDGLPRPVPVRPLKGQMIALKASVLRKPVMGDDVYLVPRGNETLVGATVEEAGFSNVVHSTAINELRAGAASLCPDLQDAPITRAWAGIRPATPDMLPILGRDPDSPALLYACGHSKNGILLAPGTAAALTALAQDRTPATPLEAFGIGRFS